MSADNYVVVKRFGDNDYRWAMFFASDDEYGIRFDEGCLHLDN